MIRGRKKQKGRKSSRRKGENHKSDRQQLPGTDFRNLLWSFLNLLIFSFNSQTPRSLTSFSLTHTSPPLGLPFITCRGQPLQNRHSNPTRANPTPRWRTEGLYSGKETYADRLTNRTRPAQQKSNAHIFFAVSIYLAMYLGEWTIPLRAEWTRLVYIKAVWACEWPGLVTYPYPPGAK
jgi:hypothetical protein